MFGSGTSTLQRKPWRTDGSEPRQVTRDGVIGHFLRWTLDGSRIVFRCPTGGKARTMSAPAAGGEATETAEVLGGAHMSLSPDESMIMDVVAHRTLWVSPLHGGAPRKVFEFSSTASFRAAATCGYSIAE